LFNCVFVSSNGPISYSYGMIYPVYAKNAVKHQSTIQPVDYIFVRVRIDAAAGGCY